MARIPQFARYAEAFENAFRTDDWVPLADLVPRGRLLRGWASHAARRGRFERGDAVLAELRFVLDAFDRRFATRELLLREGPRETGEPAWIRGGVPYTAPGLPDRSCETEETVRFRGHRISGLEDRYDAAAIETIQAYGAAHAGALGIFAA